MKVLSAVMPIQQMINAARDEALIVTGRWDVPRAVDGKPVPEDLRDTRGRMHGTPDGYRISGRLLHEDVLRGSVSAASPMLMLLPPLLGGLLPLLLVATIGRIPFLGNLTLAIALLLQIAGLLSLVVVALQEGASAYAHSATALGLFLFMPFTRPGMFGRMFSTFFDSMDPFSASSSSGTAAVIPVASFVVCTIFLAVSLLMLISARRKGADFLGSGGGGGGGSAPSPRPSSRPQPTTTPEEAAS